MKVGQIRSILLCGLGAFFVLTVGAFVLGLFIAGLWEGFSDPKYCFQFIAFVFYFIVTAGLTFYCARQSFDNVKKLMGVLFILYVPMIFVFQKSFLEGRQERMIANDYLHSDDEIKVAAARESIKSRGQRSGPDSMVAEFLAELEEAENDATRFKIVEALGHLSYQHKSVLRVLRKLYDETKGDSARDSLNMAVREAILKVNPYEDMGN